MRKSRAKQQKSKKPIIIGGIVIAVLLVVSIAVYIYRDTIFPAGDKQGEQADPQEEQVTQQEENNETSADPTTEESKEQPTFELDEGGYPVDVKEATEATYIDGILIANKKYPLPKDFDRGEDPEARAALDQMAADAKKAGFELVAFSGYRSYEYQTQLYANYANRDGKEAADRYSARPGHSEHQTGLAFDIGEKGQEDLWLTEEFGESPAGKWLVENAHNYGFILRFPKGKEDVTGFMYESWHFRYVGKEIAKEIYETGVTLEEYLGIE